MIEQYLACLASCWRLFMGCKKNKVTFSLGFDFAYYDFIPTWDKFIREGGFK